MNNLKSLIKSYEKWVASNPETVSDLETTAKWVSYFIAGRISDSNVVSELIYSLSNMLVLYNDRIIDKNRSNNQYVNGVVNGKHSSSISSSNNNTENKNNRFCYRLKVILTTLEYSEVFIEISAKRIFGIKGKWLFIVLLQITKAIGRFLILKHSTERIITTPAIPSLNRRAFIKQQKELRNGITIKNGFDISDNTNGNINTKIDEQVSNFTFQLKRSGRVVRKVEGAPPIQYRTFQLESEVNNVKRSFIPKELIQAEYLYIAKPLIHLAAMGFFGEKRWKQYVIALTLDLISIRMYHKNRHLMTKEQKLEMSRRCINLLLYFVRSPFYERYTQTRLERTLGFIANNMPLLKVVAGPLKEYIPHWQSTYFYLWST